MCVKIMQKMFAVVEGAVELKQSSFESLWDAHSCGILQTLNIHVYVYTYSGTCVSTIIHAIFDMWHPCFLV